MMILVKFIRYESNHHTGENLLNRSSIALSALLAAATTPAMAHTGVGTVSGIGAGFAHPIGGLDHLLAMIAVGVLAAQIGGRSMWLVPATFVTAMGVGGILGMAGVALPLVEQGIVGSVIILGVVIAAGRKLPAIGVMALVGLFAVFHGHAHGTEMPENAAGLLYGVGFVAATALLHIVGIGLSLGMQKMAETVAPAAIRASGGAIAIAGAGLLLL